eukprot:5615940-Prymnesium_polylepis.1
MFAAFGSKASDMYGAMAELKAEICFSAFEKLIGSRGATGEWKQVAMPSIVATLDDGESIMNLHDGPSVAVNVDYAELYPTLLPTTDPVSHSRASMYNSCRTTPR